MQAAGLTTLEEGGIQIEGCLGFRVEGFKMQGSCGILEFRNHAFGVQGPGAGVS